MSIKSLIIALRIKILKGENIIYSTPPNMKKLVKELYKVYGIIDRDLSFISSIPENKITIWRKQRDPQIGDTWLKIAYGMDYILLKVKEQMIYELWCEKDKNSIHSQNINDALKCLSINDYDLPPLHQVSACCIIS